MRGEIMQSLLAVIATWLSINFGLPATQEFPKVEFVSPMRIAALRAGGLVSAGTVNVAPSGQADDPLVQSVVAVYEDRTRTIYLPEGWTPASPAEVSVLVHEMVHHLQNLAGEKFECPGAREKSAYAAQNAWLNLFGSDLEQQFEIDPMTMLVRTNCLH
jgi:hypothetical protein